MRVGRETAAHHKSEAGTRFYTYIHLILGQTETGLVFVSFCPCLIIMIIQIFVSKDIWDQRHYDSKFDESCKTLLSFCSRFQSYLLMVVAYLWHHTSPQMLTRSFSLALFSAHSASHHVQCRTARSTACEHHMVETNKQLCISEFIKETLNMNI